MEIRQLNNAISILDSTISEFPIGASTPDDFKPIEDKIINLRESLRALDARRLTVNAQIDSEMLEDLSEGDLIRSFERLNENTTNYLINFKTLKLCYQSKAIQDIIYKNEGSEDIQQAKACLNQLFAFNDRLIAKNEKKNRLMKKQHQLRLDCHQAIYNHQDYLKEREDRRNQQLEKMNPDIAEYKDKINKSILKINTMKRLITNLIASMCKNLYENENLIEMLAEHKKIINFDTIIELTQRQNLSNIDS
ncbi:uncharacterized protein LOC131663189 isoform X2 [Phymastichus coffea]|uniref:uncharacterized protein LOC131663189 isoform X2 n=1 Tax=Phymastichus coffea TaxID=108790 RepID=UPI00273C9E03|nr:uncharacterized protein LOC131663189 isoform X2 [Phymastichus coffea]